ncbi:10.6K protein [Mirafiori lettuce big-vein virus]|uniref:Uncharacterized 10.6 kDa protein n=1 Tax=Mirafiori lettuce virus (isolate Lettuce/Netherlands/LS301-O) TaxID=652964 RepID=VG11_MILVL|nr:RecName: Full=Uncharacterized 10.6 kDa protein [Mirafiori lettuce virus LS301-O]AAN60452.1 10.6K protein [Mirafiori lettuce big-vein virus]
MKPEKKRILTTGEIDNSCFNKKSGGARTTVNGSPTDEKAFKVVSTLAGCQRLLRISHILLRHVEVDTRTYFLFSTLVAAGGRTLPSGGRGQGSKLTGEAI